MRTPGCTAAAADQINIRPCEASGSFSGVDCAMGKRQSGPPTVSTFLDYAGIEMDRERGLITCLAAVALHHGISPHPLTHKPSSP